MKAWSLVLAALAFTLLVVSSTEVNYSLIFRVKSSSHQALKDLRGHRKDPSKQVESSSFQRVRCCCSIIDPYTPTCLTFPVTVRLQTHQRYNRRRRRSLSQPSLTLCRNRSTLLTPSVMREPRDGARTDSSKPSKAAPPPQSFPLILDIDDFKGDFSFDALFGNLVNDLLPSYKLEESESDGGDALPNGHLRVPSDASKYSQGIVSPLFPEVEKLLSLFKDSCKELLELRKQIDGRLYNLKKDVSVQDSKHRKTLAELEKGVDGLFDSFARLDSRISSVGQTAAKIGDHLQSADAQRETASQTIELIKYLMEFNSSPGDLMELSPLFSDDSRVAEAASIAQKLRSFAEEDIGRHGIPVPSAMGNATASRGLEVAVANLQDYCNGLTESLFSSHKDEYPEYEQASLRQLYKVKMEELRAESQQISDSSGSIGRSKGASVVSSQQQISVTVVTEFVRWNEEAISRCNLFASQPATLATHVKAVFTCLLDQVSQYIADGLERARDSLTEAANLRERFVLGTSVTRRVAAAAASAAEAAAAAGESSFRSFMIAVQRSGSSVAIIQQYFANSISRLLLPVDGAHAAACEEMATAMSSAEAAAYKGLQQCIETVMAEVERLLSAEQKATDYRSPDDGMAPDHRATSACTRWMSLEIRTETSISTDDIDIFYDLYLCIVVAYLSRVLESAFTALEGLNKQAFLTELGNRLHKVLLNHWQKYTFNPSGGLRLKRDITEYGEFLRSFNAPSVDEKFELLGIMANVFIVAPESLSTLFEGTPSIRKDAQRFIQLRDDYKAAKLASKLSSLWS
ncbi:hypothetical protein JHK85_017983 [Glycine max]|nr:hypothetical protein JHK85_017983 [Glycine max]